MRIVVLQSARDDLANGYWFYEDQGEGVGIYFLESLFSDIDSLIYTPGFTERFLAVIDCYQNGFPMQYIIR